MEFFVTFYAESFVLSAFLLKFADDLNNNFCTTNKHTHYI